jgi:hypothetical protein
MKSKGHILLLMLLIFPVQLFCQHSERKNQEIPKSFCISQMEFKLYTMINEYRARYDLPAIPLSKSLSFVASTHVKDLVLNHPDKGSCNSHSWSAKGTWKPFCYPKDENKKNSVWDKPRELTSYRGKGYEIVYWENNATIIDSIITFWKSVDYFNSFLMNTGKWTGKRWNAIGIGIYENYAVAWFGELVDPDGQPGICGSTSDTVKRPSSQKPATGKKSEHPKSQGATSSQAAAPLAPVPVTPPPLPSETRTETQKAANGRYYIIVKSQSPRAEMEMAQKDLQNRGYSGSRLLEKDRKLRLSLMDFKEKKAADSALKEIKKTFNDAWIMKY